MAKVTEVTTITETFVELADRHTTLYHFKEPPNPATLAFNDPDKYSDLHRTLATRKTVPYSEFNGGKPGVILDKLSPAYQNHKYWSRYLSSKDYESYPDRAWQNLLPIRASLATKVSFALKSKLPFSVRPLPRVLLYPFGWSACLSLRLTGAFRVSELASFLQRVVAEKAFTILDGGPLLSLSELFNQIARGVRADAFGKTKTGDKESSEAFVVTTVMAKHGVSPAIGALDFEEQTQMLRLVRPASTLSGRPFEEHVFQWPKAKGLKYVLFDDVGRFNWLEHLLFPEGRNRQLLHCYHNNSFLTLLQADHFVALLDAAGKEKLLSEKLFDVTQTAKSYLESPTFRNASLRAFLGRSDVKESITRAAKLALPRKTTT